jgi:hypothetical protein
MSLGVVLTLLYMLCVFVATGGHVGISAKELLE